VKRFILAELRQRRRTTVALGLGAMTLLVAFGGSYQAFVGPVPSKQLFGGKPPSAVTAFSGTRDIDVFTPHHYLAFGFNHPLFLVLTLSVAVGVASASVAGDVETGRAELLYARPIARHRLVLGRVGVWFVLQVVELALALAGSMAGTRLSHDLRAAGVGHVFLVPVQTLSLTAFVVGAGFLASSCTRTRSAASSLTIAIVATAFLVNFIALVWQPASALRWATPFGYYEPLRTMDSGVNWVNWSVLTGTGAALFGASLIRLRQRDLV